MANPKPGTKTSLVQALGDGASSITKSIEITSRPRTRKDVDYLFSETAIAMSSHEEKQKDPTPTKPTLLKPTETSQYLPTVPESPSPGLEGARPLAPPASISPPPANRDFSKARSRHRPRPRLSAPPIAPASQQHIGNACLWRAPEDWEYEPTEAAAPSAEGGPPEAAVVPAGAGEESGVALDLASMQREARRMLQASPRAVLLRLKGVWGGYGLDPSGGGDLAGVGDPSPAALESALTYKELEMEKKRWMLCALGHMEAVADPNGVFSQLKVRPRAQRVLSLFDSQATASYLAYVNSGLPVYHLSPDPLSRKQYPNVHPLQCPLVAASSVTLPAGTYSAVNCLPIASAVPSSEIPPLLARIHEVLAGGGALSVVVLDPLPRARSAGPALRQWLDENLVFNLEQQFRCTNPSRNFPVWLQDARLRARGSVITTTRFQAVPPRGRGGGGGGSRGGEEEDEVDEDEESEVATRMELRTVVGRMLWQDIWGPFVTADRWWWDVPEIVDECLGLATHWEYSTIVACKETDD